MTTPTRQTLLQIVEQARALAKAETAVIALAEDGGQQVYYHVAAGKHAERLTERRAPAATSGLCGVTFQQNAPVLVCQTKGDQRVRQDHAQALGIDTALAVPFHHEGELLGAIMVLNRTDGTLFDQQTEQTLSDFAREVAPEIARYLATRPL